MLKTSIAIAALIAAPALAQQTTGSSASTPADRDVRASTYGNGTATPDSVAVSGGGEASTTEGGTSATRSDARFNDNTARQRSVATARDDDERARSRTQTTVRKDGDVRSRSMSIYKERGEKPVITRETNTTAAPPR